MDFKTIVAGIRRHIELSNVPDYRQWRIGITNRPAARRQEHTNEGRDTSAWHHWLAINAQTAQDVEAAFINEALMAGGTGGNIDATQSTYVYVF